MTSAVFPIHPVYAEAIYEGRKRCEYRRRSLRRTPEWLIIYETAPVSMVTGLVRVTDVLTCDAGVLWDHTHDFGGVSRQAFDAYFGDGVGTAYMLGAPCRLKRPIEVTCLGIAGVPQSMCYVDGEVARKLLGKAGGVS